MTRVAYFSTAMALATALAVGPAPSVAADQAGFHGARTSTVDRISPFAPEQSFCASQDLGVWTFLVGDSREEVALALDQVEISFVLDNEQLEVQTSSIKPFLAIDPGHGEVPGGAPGQWRVSVGDPDVGPLSVGDHDLTTTLTFFGGAPIAFGSTITIDGC